MASTRSWKVATTVDWPTKGSKPEVPWTAQGIAFLPGTEEFFAGGGGSEPKRCLFFAEEKGRWKISEARDDTTDCALPHRHLVLAHGQELGDNRNFAFLKVQDRRDALRVCKSREAVRVSAPAWISSRLLVGRFCEARPWRP